MNKHLNNFLDKAEGLPKETTNKNIEKELAVRNRKSAQLMSWVIQKMKQKKYVHYMVLNI